MRPRALAVRMLAHALSPATVPALPPMPDPSVSPEWIPAEPARDIHNVLRLLAPGHGHQRARVIGARSFPAPALHPSLSCFAFRSFTPQHRLLFPHRTTITRRLQCHAHDRLYGALSLRWHAVCSSHSRPSMRRRRKPQRRVLSEGNISSKPDCAAIAIPRK